MNESFECNECPILLLEFIAPEITDRRNEFIPDTRDNWNRAQVKRAAKDSTIALTKGMARRASNARRNNAQSFTPVFSEPIRVLIAECSTDELRDIWIENRNIMRELDCSIKELNKLWNRLQRINHWIELHVKYSAYREAPRELTDNEFIASVMKEMRGDITV